MKNKLLAGPYLVWMVIFTLVPLGIVVYYAFTDSVTGAFTLENLSRMKCLRLNQAVYGWPADVQNLHDIFHRIAAGLRSRAYYRTAVFLHGVRSLILLCHNCLLYGVCTASAGQQPYLS